MMLFYANNNIPRLQLLAALLITGGIIATIVGATQLPQTPNGGAPFIGDAASYNEALQKEQLQSTGFRVIVIGLSVFGSGFLIVVFRSLFSREEFTDPLPLQQSIALNLPPPLPQRRVRIAPDTIVIREERPAAAAPVVVAPSQEQQQQDVMRKARAWLGDEADSMRPMATGPHITIMPLSAPRRSHTTAPV